jgi:hypothetical protein
MAAVHYSDTFEGKLYGFEYSGPPDDVAAALSALMDMGAGIERFRRDSAQYVANVHKMVPIIQKAWELHPKKAAREAAECGDGLRRALEQDLRLRVGDEVIMVNSEVCLHVVYPYTASNSPHPLPWPDTAC